MTLHYITLNWDLIFTKPQLHKNAFLSENLKIFDDFSKELICEKIYPTILENTMFQNFYHFGVN